MLFAVWQDFVFQFSDNIVHNGFALLTGKLIFLTSKSNESFADAHQLRDFFSHVHLHGLTLSLRSARRGLGKTPVGYTLLHEKRRKACGLIRSRCRRGSGGSAIGERRMTSSTTPLQRSRLLFLVHDRLVVGVLMEALACRRSSPCAMLPVRCQASCLCGQRSGRDCVEELSGIARLEQAGICSFQPCDPR